jgi:hypothetical protein
MMVQANPLRICSSISNDDVNFLLAHFCIFPVGENDFNSRKVCIQDLIILPTRHICGLSRLPNQSLKRKHPGGLCSSFSISMIDHGCFKKWGSDLSLFLLLHDSVMAPLTNKLSATKDSTTHDSSRGSENHRYLYYVERS